MYAETLSEIGRYVEEVKMITGVKDARAALFTSHFRFTGMLDERIKSGANM